MHVELGEILLVGKYLGDAVADLSVVGLQDALGVIRELAREKAGPSAVVERARPARPHLPPLVFGPAAQGLQPLPIPRLHRRSPQVDRRIGINGVEVGPTFVRVLVGHEQPPPFLLAVLH